MRKLLVVIFAISLVAGCVSNRTFQAERERIGRIEYQQMRMTNDFGYLRSDYEVSKDSLDVLMAHLESELSLLREDLSSLNTGIIDVRNEFADYSERSDTAITLTQDQVSRMQASFSDLSSNVATLQTASEAQIQEYNRFKEAYESNQTFNDDVLISFDQRLEELRQNLSTSESRLQAIDSRYAQIAIESNTRIDSTRQRVAQLESGIQTETGRLADIQNAHNANLAQTEGVVLDTVQRIEILERRLANEHNTINEIIAVIGDLETTINNLQLLVQETTNATMSSVELGLQENQSLTASMVEESNAQTRAELAEINAKLEQMRQTLAGTRTEVDGEISTVRSQVSSVASELTVVANDLEAISSRSNRGTDRVVTSYNNARAYYNRGNFEEAIVRLEAFITANPNHAYVPNALYWIGESYYAGRNMPKATRSFQDVIDRYPNNAKALDAKIKLAMIQAFEGDKQAARQSLESFKAQHPDYQNMALINRLLRGWAQ
jgi:tol-pal system protein YbgF